MADQAHHRLDIHVCMLDPYTHSVIFVGYRQTVKTQIRRRKIAASDQGLNCLLTKFELK